MSAHEEKAGSGPGPPAPELGAHRAQPPSPFDCADYDHWSDFLAARLARRDTARNIARYGQAVAEQYATGSFPRTAKELDTFTGGDGATNILGRSSWRPEDLAFECAAEALKCQPDLLLATSLPTRFTRADNFRIYSTSALYGDGRCVPIGLSRSFGEHDERADQAVARLVDATTNVATSGGCDAPLVTCELDLADYVIERLAGDTYPFAAAIGPEWFHLDIAHNVPRDLLGSSPFELFLAHPDRDYIHRRVESGLEAHVVPMQYRGRDNGLFYVLVPHARRPFFLVRPASTDVGGIHRHMTKAVALAFQAAAIYDAAPVGRLGLEHFNASAQSDVRWLKHMTVVQALLTFRLIDPFSHRLRTP
jgi:hypothetical protein